MPNLSVLEDIAIDMSDISIGENPVLLGRLIDDPLHLILGGGLLGMFALALPGAGWLVALGVVGATINDTAWALDDDDFDGETVDVQADPVAALRNSSPDSWVDTALSQGYQVLPESTDSDWPPAVQSKAFSIETYSEALDMLADGPDAIVAFLGDRAPDWVRSAATAHPNEDAAVTDSDSSSDSSSDWPVTGSKQFVNGMTLTEFKRQLCPIGGELEVSDLNTERGRQNASAYVSQFVEHYGVTPIEFLVWWGWGLTKKGGSSPGAKAYKFVADFVVAELEILKS